MPQFQSTRSLGVLAALATATALLAGQPAQAHSIASGGLAAGFMHPLAGTDHLLLLIGVGAAASYLSTQLLLWGLAGALIGGVFGATGGGLPAAELLAAVAVPAVAFMVLRGHRSSQAPALGACGSLIAAAVAVHAMLHGQEAPAGAASALWWAGCFSATLLVSGGSYLLLRRLPTSWTTAIALLLAVYGGWMVLAPLGLVVR
jgi:urease accessory protein